MWGNLHTVWNFYNNQTCSCPRDCRLSLGIMGEQLWAPFKPLEHNATIVPRGLRGTLNYSPMMPRGTRVLYNRGKFFFPVWHALLRVCAANLLPFFFCFITFLCALAWAPTLRPFFLFLYYYFFTFFHHAFFLSLYQRTIFIWREFLRILGGTPNMPPLPIPSEISVYFQNCTWKKRYLSGRIFFLGVKYNS